jgi:hypothetical protein
MTATWCTCNLGDAMLAGEALEEIRTVFASYASRAGAAADMAIFVRHESEGRLHCEVHVYFSPAAGEVAAAFDARACTKPSAQSLGLLAGSEAAREALFPGS